MPSSKKKKQVPNTLITVSRKGTTYQQNTNQSTQRAYGSTYEDSDEYEEVIIDRSAAEIIAQINKRVKSPYYSIYCGIAGIILLFVFPPLSIVIAVATYLVYKEDDIEPGDQNVGLVVSRQLFSLFRPTKRGKRPQGGGEPSVENVFVSG